MVICLSEVTVSWSQITYDIQDSTNTAVESPIDSSYRRHLLKIGYMRSSFSGEESLIQDFNAGWQVKLNQSWSISNDIAMLSGDNQKSYSFGHTLNFQKERTGAGVTIRYSNNPLAPNNSLQLNTYKWLSEQLIIGGQISRIDFNEVPNLWPFKLSTTWVSGKFGWTAGLTQDMSRLSSIDPLYNFSITHETVKSDVFNIYCSVGSIYQPQFRFQLVESSSTQLAYGGWFRKNISSVTSITGGWGYTQIKDQKQSIIKTTQLHLSISYKL